MLVIQSRADCSDRFEAELVLAYDLRQKCRLRTQSTQGEEVGLFLPRGEVLRNGDVLQAQDGRRVRVTAKPEKVLQIECADPLQLTRIAYHLGNRHVALQVGDGWLRIADDYVLRQMAQGLGGTVSELEAPFEPESGAYGGHMHAAEPPAHRGIIHQFSSGDPS
ncbi:MAG TPA: urease accessory protein UreE [Burkholderiales bacterium]|nr:urease accessory protein UreE [Burkholderiales bacterium]